MNSTGRFLRFLGGETRRFSHDVSAYDSGGCGARRSDFARRHEAVVLFPPSRLRDFVGSNRWAAPTRVRVPSRRRRSRGSKKAPAEVACAVGGSTNRRRETGEFVISPDDLLIDDTSPPGVLMDMRTNEAPALAPSRAPGGRSAP